MTPKTMNAVEITAPGGPEVLVLNPSRVVPTVGYGEVLIKVAYAGVNRPDALQRAGAYNPPKGASDLPGLEASGHIAVIGAGVTEWKVGDAVCALLPGGGYAEYVSTEAAHCLPIPAGMSLLKAAGLPENHFTVYSNLVMRAGLIAGEKILIHGGSSGIGTTAIQLAATLGCRVFATAGTDEKCAACVVLGAEAAFNYRDTDFVAEMRERGRADVILDMVGGSYMQRNIKTLADDGRLVQIAFLQGPKVELNMVEIMTRRLTLTGSTLRPQSNLAKARIAAGLARDVWPKLANGQIDVIVDSEYALADAAAAHARMETSAHIGKIMLKVGD